MDDSTNSKEKNQSISLNEKLEIIDNQIHSLNYKVNNPKKETWFKKNASLVISIIALTTSIVFTLYGNYKESVQNESSSESKRLQKIQDFALKLTSIAEKNAKLNSMGYFTNNQNMSVLLNTQRLFYMNQIIDLIQEERDSALASDIYSLIGSELKMDGRYEDALKYFKLELKNTNSSASKVVANRNLGNLYGIKDTKIFKRDSSNFYWKQSISIAEQLPGELKHHYKGYSFQLWAGNELYSNNIESGLKLIDSARNEYLKLPDNNSIKQLNINMLSQMIENESMKEFKSVFFNLKGEWTTLSNNYETKYIYFYQNPGGWTCNLQFFKNNRLAYSLSGQLVSTSKEYMIFTVQGMKKINGQFSDRIQLLGTLKLFKDKSSEHILNASFNEINSIEEEFVLYKKK